MNQKETTRKVLFELIQYGVVDPYYSKIVEQYLDQVYCIGCNEGRSTHTIKKAIVQYDKEGNEIGRFESVTVAGNRTEIPITNISAAARGERCSAGGYYWKYKNV